MRRKIKKRNQKDKKIQVGILREFFYVVVTYIAEKPDIMIETCKSIIDGISKLTLYKLTQEPLSKLKSHKFEQLFKKALHAIEKRSLISFDIRLPDRQGSVARHLVGMINEHGDICHVKISLKEQIKVSDMSEIVIGITDSIKTYMLKKLDQIVVDDKAEYDAILEFNQWLDDLYPLDGNLKYSKALNEQVPVSYEEQFGDFSLDYHLEE